MKMAGVEIRVAHNILVRLVSDQGVTGWGEAASAPTMTGETVESMAAAVRYLAPSLEGMRGDDLEAIDREMAFRLHANHAAKSAIDMALLDMVGRTRAMPVHALIGAAVRSSVPVLWMLAGADADADANEAREKRRDGFRAFKLKVGTGTPDGDARRTVAICDTLGSEPLVSADANQGFSVADAIRYVRAVGHTGLAFFEQPVMGADLAGMAEVARASRIPIGADEGIHGIDDIRRHHDDGAAAGVSLKTIKLGGVRATCGAGRLCAQLGMQVNLACKIAESSISAAAVMHLAAVLPSVAWGVSLSNQYLSEDLVVAPLAVERGEAAVPMGPGLGVDVDEDRVRAFRM